MRGLFKNLYGTLLNTFGIGPKGARLNWLGDRLGITNAAGEDIPLQASELHLTGDVIKVGTTVYTLPEDDGTIGQALKTNGEGDLYWDDAGSGEGGAGSIALTLIPYTVSQSTVENDNAACLGTYENLTDGNSTTGAGTKNTAGLQFIQADTGGLHYLNAIGVAAGTLGGGFGIVHPYLNGKQIEVSLDGTSWMPVQTVGQTDIAGYPVVWNAIGMYGRYVRLSAASTWVGTTALLISGY